MSSLSVQQQEQLQGNFTSVIYSLIRDQQYTDAVEILQLLVQDFPRSRAALSLLAYCQYFAQDFFGAATAYETLVTVFPDVEGYKMHYAQSLYKAGMFAEAMQACLAVNDDDPQHRARMLQLQASIKFAQEELAGCRSLVDRCDQDDAEVGIFRACILFKEGKFDDAQRGFEEASQALGYRPHLTYNLGLCHYEQSNYADALRSIGIIIERGVNDHPELSVGSNSGEHAVQSVGNSQLLAMTALVEAFNLKAAIEFRLDNMQIAQSALNNMPPRREEELDPITLHNQALMNFDKEPQAALRKLNWLIVNPPFPPPTFQNLLLLYIENKCHTLAADVLADNAHLTFECLSQPMYDFIDAHLMTVSDPAEAFRRFEGLKQKHVATLRSRTKMISDARSTGVKDEVKKALGAYDATLEEYIPCLMAQAHIYWERGNYLQVENIFRQSAEFCSEHEKWKLNVAHTFFMQEQDKFAEALRYYEPFVQQFEESICDVQAIVLANLCVSYIMTTQNEEAEEIMRKIEREEEQIQFRDPEKQCLHLCIVNLVIGTLYCTKGNYEFGISRIIKSMEPYDKKLDMDTWYYAKRCLATFAEMVAKHIVIMKDQTYYDITTFLEAAERFGKDIKTVNDTGATDPLEAVGSSRTVSYEARVLKTLFMRLHGE